VCIVTGHPSSRVIYERPVPPPEGYLEKPVDESKLVAYATHIIEAHGESTRWRATRVRRRCPTGGAVRDEEA